MPTATKLSSKWTTVVVDPEDRAVDVRVVRNPDWSRATADECYRWQAEYDDGYEDRVEGTDSLAEAREIAQGWLDEAREEAREATDSEARDLLETLLEGGHGAEVLALLKSLTK